MEANEKEFEQLRQLSYALAMNMMKNHDDAEDVAQNTLIQFINTEDIQNAEAWTKKVTHNLVVEKFRDHKKNLNISHKLNVNESEEEETTRKKKELLDFNHLTQEKIKKYLNPEERLIFKEFRNADFNIKKYAEIHYLSYNIALKRIQKLRKNLKAAYLKDNGHELTSTLTISQWNTIYSMVRRKFLKKENVPFPIDEFLTFCFMKKKDHQLIFVVGKYKKTPVFFIINGLFLKNRFRINDVYAPKLVKEITYEELLLIKSRSTFNPIV